VAGPRNACATIHRVEAAARAADNPRPALPRALVLGLLVLGLLLSALVVPGVFTIDEPHYLVTVLGLRQGRLTVPGTEGLPPSRSLAYFDPQGQRRVVTQTPIAATVPPLYAPLALPFSFLGWRGLVLLNTLGFLAVTALVFFATSRHAADPRTAWLAAGTFALGGYALEYAIGLWPHMVSAALTTAAVVLAGRVRDGAGLGWAAVAGGLAGLAAGVRYQNVLVVGLVGLGLLLLGSRRIAATACYGLGAAAPLAAAAWMNHHRLDTWNPISKGAGYLPDVSLGTLLSAQHGVVRQLWGRVVDHSAAYIGANWGFIRVDPATGAPLIGDVLKKAWLQSAPWLLVALAFLALAWVTTGRLRPECRRESRALGLVVFGVLGGFSLAGNRSDGLNFNQRYLIELVPLCAIAFAWALDGIRLRTDRTLLGFGLGGLAAWTALRWLPQTPALVLQLYLPVGLAAALAGAWLLAIQRAPRPWIPGALAALAGASLGWALVVHVGADLRESLTFRQRKLNIVNALSPVVPSRSAIVIFGNPKDALAPLQLDRDVVIVDAGLDRGATAPEMVQALLAQGRRVFLFATGVPRPMVAALAGPTEPRIALLAPPLFLLELGGRP
jgi:hypothetical protein